MRAHALWLGLVSSCGGLSQAPEVAPIGPGPNIAEGVTYELAGADPARAAGFYAAILGGTATAGADAGSFVVDRGGGGLTFVHSEVATPPIVRIDVVDLDAALVELAARRIPFEIRSAPDGRGFAHVTDPDGRPVELHER